MSIDASKSLKAELSLPAKGSANQSKGDNVSLPPSADQTASKPTNLENLNIKVGQAILAKVLDVATANTKTSDKAMFNTTLDIGGKAIQVSTEIQLKPGQVLQVTLNSKGELTLPPPKTDTISPLIKAISHVLPHQQSIGKAVASILQSLPLLTAQNPELKALGEQLTSLLPKADQFKSPALTPQLSAGSTTTTNPQNLTSHTQLQLIKSALANSGIFMENALATAAKANSTAPTAAQLNQTANPIPPGATAASQTSSPVSSTTPLPLTAGQLTAPLPISDIKSVISQLTHTLSNSYATNGGAPRSLIAESNHNLLISPFNFPIPLASLRQNADQQERELSVGDLLKRLAGALNRIQFNQLNSIYQSQTNSTDTVVVQSWQMELPFLNSQKEIDPIQVRIDQEDAKDSEDEDSEKKSKWRLSLSFDLDDLGPLYIQVNLMPPNISSTLWADKKETLKLLNSETHNLRDSLIEMGLTVEDISCRHGQPNLKKTRIDQQIVDTKA